MNTLKSWSFSSLMMYEKCPRSTFYKYIEHIPEPEPEPDSPLVRGNRVHSEIENFITDRSFCPPPGDVELYKELHRQWCLGHVFVEHEWGFDLNWNVVDWRNATCRMKLDCGASTGKDNELRIIDWKTGKKTGNEIKHCMQGQLYAIGALARMSTLERIFVEFHYVDHPDEKPLTATYTPDKIAIFRKTYDRRAAKMLSDTEFRAVPNKSNCRFCPFNHHCPTAVI